MNQSALKRSNLDFGPPMGEPSSKRVPKTTLAVLPDDLDEATHQSLNDRVLRNMQVYKNLGMLSQQGGTRLALLQSIVQQSDGLLVSKDVHELSALITNHPELGAKLDEAWNKESFNDIRNLKILRPAVQHAGFADLEVILDSQLSKDAAVKSWSSTYKGNAADILSLYMTGPCGPNVYARLLPVVQSSGMGKSRMVDEFSKYHFVVPFNLRKGVEGYPAPDHAILHWLTYPGLSQLASDDRFSAFLTALFEKLSDVLDDLKSRIKSSKLSDAEKTATLKNYPESLAEQFRLFMTVGQQFDEQGPLRVQFYKDVLNRANKASRLFYVAAMTLTVEAAIFSTVELTSVIKRVLEKIAPDYQSAQHTPVLCLAFDEAHTLTTPNPGGDPIPFTSLRRALRALRTFPIWSLFLSTTGKSDQFSPPSHLDPSSRILKGELVSIKPFSALGFDHMAKEFDGVMTLDNVTELSYRLSLGRPLWLTRYQAGGDRVKETITTFAIEKLLCRAWKRDNLARAEMFAVMSHRLVLDFNTTVYSGQQRAEAERDQMRQVERHMRVCLGVKEGFESVVTVAASEPILTEAAATILCSIRDTVRSCHMLEDILQWPGISKGDRGELITCNIIIDTLDDLMGVMVTSLFQALFARDIYDTSIKDSLPSMLLNGSRNRSFAETFKSSRIYVTHFIKVYDFEVLSVNYLFKLAARGVGVVCADNQGGVDVVIPILYKDTVLQADNMTVLMIQSKNDHSYSTKPSQDLFDKMDPSKLGIFPKKQKTLPVIRMVIALASKKSIVSVIGPPPRTQPARQGKQLPIYRKNAYTSFDVWCARASSRTFRTIRPQDVATYDALLRLSKDVPEMFEPSETLIQDSVRRMYPGGTSHAGHWSFCTK
ncbi:uncharacterized protein EI90DRAFT_3072219 [Cantharellus anzutake]|uniref:uncharacterized protein n=1 Tax=Cantharellus anzutake TaxID=1750568 RepID=UPI001906A73E|nr:uncharacterized protein EI90DRAFT_3072219 [Cantharellus anzutake]KAF8325609.1 hypothetical protein EI90DRAFT_3072219 [Cantharellus anzutake]